MVRRRRPLTGVLLCFLGLSCASEGPPPDPAEQIRVPAGPFTMGLDDVRARDEGPAHRVDLSAYYLDRREVSNRQFAAFVEATGYRTTAEAEGESYNWRRPGGKDAGIEALMDHPVVYVSWYDAHSYCAWRGGHLPSEAQWEKGARGEDGRLWPWGGRFDSQRANHWGSEDGYEATAPTGRFPAGASPYGALDMAGNVWEWCADWEGRNYAEAAGKDPEGPGEGRFKIVRGGSWINPPLVLRTTNRFRILPVDRSPYVGFRCAHPD